MSLGIISSFQQLQYVQKNIGLSTISPLVKKLSKEWSPVKCAECNVYPFPLAVTIHMDSYRVRKKISAVLEWPWSNAVKWDLLLMEVTSFYQGFNGKLSAGAASINTLTEISICRCWTLGSTPGLCTAQESSFPRSQVLILCYCWRFRLSLPGPILSARVSHARRSSSHDAAALMTRRGWIWLQRMSPLLLTLISGHPLSCNSATASF